MYKRYWLIQLMTNGFESMMLLYGTEEELRNYLDSELPNGYRYHGVTDEEVETLKKFGMKAYLA